MVLGLLIRFKLCLVPLNGEVILFVFLLEGFDIDGKEPRVLLHKELEGLRHLENGFEEISKLFNRLVDVRV